MNSTLKTILTIIIFTFLSSLSMAQKMNKSVDRSAEAYASEQILINADIEKVYGIVADIENWKDWKPNVTGSELKGKLKKNGKFSFVVEDIKINSKFHTVIPHTHLGWISKKIVAKATQNWIFESQENGTLVTFEQSLKGPLPQDLIDAVPYAVTSNLAALKTAAEK